MKKCSFLVILVFGFVVGAFSQDLPFARRLVDTLASPSFHGRGYVAKGDALAATFLASLFDSLGLKPFGESYMQTYSFPMNSLPGTLVATADGNMLRPGIDFQVWAATPDFEATAHVEYFDNRCLTRSRRLARFSRHDHSVRFLLVDRKGITDKKSLSILDSLRYYNFAKALGVVQLLDAKPTWSVMMGASVAKWPVVDLKREALMGKRLTQLRLEVQSDFDPNHIAHNVMAWVKGVSQPDTFIVFTAHYDHLGQMGKSVYYPGANDNASGTAMVCDLARQFAHAKPYYSMAFLLFSGEEAGLKGSKFCAAHPPFALSAVKQLINLDMVGTGSEGITVVNGEKYPEVMKTLTAINDAGGYLQAVKSRGESCNSDHCPFYQKGVPSVFIYSMGKEFVEYHNPDDRAAKLPFTDYDDIFRLLTQWVQSMSLGNKP